MLQEYVHPILKKFKRTSLGVLKAGRAFRLIEASGWRGRRLIILAYLGVSLDDEHEWDPACYLSPEQFERRLDILRRNGCSVLPLRDALDRLYRGGLPPRSVALTFDAGNHDFFARAWPMIRSYGYPATVFLTTYYCEFNRPIFDIACSYLLWKAASKVDRIPGEPVGLTEDLDIRTHAGRLSAKDVLIAVSREWRLDGEDMDHLLERIAQAAGIDYGTLRVKRILHLLSCDEVRALAAEGVDFQLHTHRHRTPLDPALFRKEIEDNRARILSLTGREPDIFSYPNGSTRPEFLPWLAEAGVRYAVTCRPGPAAATSPALLLPRFSDHARLSPVEFESIVSGVACWMPHGRHRSGVPYDLSRLHASHGL